MAAGRLPALPGHARARLGEAADRPDRPAGAELLQRAEGPQVQVAGRSAAGAAGHLRQAGRAAARTRQAGRGGGGRGVRFGQRGHHLPQGTGREGRAVLLDVGSGARASRHRAQVPRQRGADRRQLLRRAELGGVLRWQLRVHPEGRALPDGTEHLLPHQRRPHRPVRAHPDRVRGRRLRVLPRRLHRADARREPAPATKTGSAASTTSSPSAPNAAARAAR